ncbi:MAK10-like protein [Tanacetum coccineum]
MGDENPIRTLGDYSKPSHEGYRNTIGLPVGNNLVPFRSDTIRLVQNGCSFHGLRSEDPNQHLKDFLKLMDSLDLDGENRERTRLHPSPQPQALETTFKDRVQDYMAAHTERMGFKNTIFKQREEINDRMTEMFGLLKELTTNRTPEKVLIREEAKFPITKNVNSISFARNKKEENNKTDETPDNTKMPTETEMPVRKVETINGSENGTRNESIKTAENDEAILPGGPAYDAILKKKVTKKDDIRGNFKIPCSIGGLKHINALVDQGSDVNVMPYSTYMKLTNEKPAKTDIRLSLASHSYIYPLGIAEDVLVEVTEHVYPVDFVVLDIKENEKRLFI